MRMPGIVAVFLAVFLMTAGCAQEKKSAEGSFLGLRTVDSCDNDVTLVRDAQKMQCYYAAAISMAYTCGIRVSQSSLDLSCPQGSQTTTQSREPCTEAADICDKIYLTWQDGGDDIKRKAELLTDHCFYDVAKITRNSATCNYILEGDDIGSQLTGGRATREMCIDEVERLAKITPEAYYCNNDNICMVVFVLPLLLGLAIARQGP